MRKTIIQTLSIKPDVWDYLKKRQNKSEVVNQALREFIKRQQTPKEVLKKLRTEKKALAKKIFELEEKEEKIEEMMEEKNEKV